MAYTGSLYASGSYGGLTRQVSVSVTVEGTTLTYSINSASTTSSWPYTRVGFYVNGTLVYDSGYVRSYSSFPSNGNGTYTGSVSVSEYGDISIAVGVGISKDNLTDATDSGTISRPSAPTTTPTYTQIVYVRYQQSDGTWGNYGAVVNGAYTAGSTVSWSRSADSIYKAASISYSVSGAATKYVDVYRQTYVQTINIRYQNADATFGDYSTVATDTMYYGSTWSCTWGGDTVYAETNLSYTVTSTVTKTVDIYRNEYPVHFDPNGGLFTPSDQYYIYGGTTALSKYRPTKAGYRFLGWSTDSTATEIEYAHQGDYTWDDSETTLYAVWEEIDQSMYLCNDGTVFVGQLVEDSVVAWGSHGHLIATELDEKTPINTTPVVVYGTDASGVMTWYEDSEFTTEASMDIFTVYKNGDTEEYYAYNGLELELELVGTYEEAIEYIIAMVCEICQSEAVDGYNYDSSSTMFPAERFIEGLPPDLK